jgi:hypothetical protein
METPGRRDAETKQLDEPSLIQSQAASIEGDRAAPQAAEAFAERGERAPSPFRVLKETAALKPVEVAAAFVVIFAAMAWIEFSGPAMLDVDAYYHMQWSRALRESFPALPAFRALPFTMLNEQDYVDHHYLFHVMLIPFTFGDWQQMVFAGKLAAVIFASLGMVSLFALMVSYRLPYRWLWLLPLIASSEPFLFRMAMTRAPAMSLGMLGLGTYLILKRKYIWLGALSFAFVWYYSLFPLIFIFVLAHAATVYVSERRFEWKAVVASATGIVAGLIINPYFPKNLILLYEHLRMKTTAGSDYSVSVGMEWYPYDSWMLFVSSAIAFVLFFAGLFAFNYRDRVRDAKPLFFLIISTILLLMFFKSKRFVEYWPPFAVTFAAFTISPRLASMNFGWLRWPIDRAIAAVTVASLLIVSVWVMTATMAAARIDFQTGQGIYNIYDKADRETYWPDTFRRAGLWIRENAPPGSIVFNMSWDDFPMLYFYSPESRFIAGLDPSYMHDRDKDLWDLYVDITMGRVSNPAPVIRERFGAEYVFSKGRGDFLRSDDNFEVVHEDKYTSVFRILSPEEKEARRELETSSGGDDEQESKSENQ